MKEHCGSLCARHDSDKAIYYVYNELGNRKTRTTLSGTVNSYDYRNYSEIIQAGAGFQYTHDDNGNIISAGASQFVYNAENQMIQFVYSGSVAASYEYDWRGLRSKKTIGSKVELYYYTGDELTYITDGTNRLKYYFVRDLYGRPQQMIDYTGTTPNSYIYILDVHGNVIGLADSTGIVVNYEYDAWGNLLNTPQTVLTGNGENLADANPFRYSGYQFDKETGFYYLKYRYYIPSLGRFLTRDPMLNINRYVYCRNNPINLVDSFGLLPIVEDERGEILQVFPNGNIRNRRTGKLMSKTVKKPIIEFRGKLGRGLEVKPKIAGISLELGGARYMEGLTTDAPMETIELNLNVRLGKERNIFLGAAVQASRDLITGQPIPGSQVAFVGLKVGKFQL